MLKSKVSIFDPILRQLSVMAATVKDDDDVEDDERDKDADCLFRQHDDDYRLINRWCSRLYRFHISVSVHQVHSDARFYLFDRAVYVRIIMSSLLSVCLSVCLFV